MVVCLLHNHNSTSEYRPFQPGNSSSTNSVCMYCTQQLQNWEHWGIEMIMWLDDRI